MSDLRILVEDEEFGEDFYVNVTFDDLSLALKQAGMPVVAWCVEHQGTQRFGDLWVCPVAEQNAEAGRFCRIETFRCVRVGGE